MVDRSGSNKSVRLESERYEPPKLTKFGTIEEWTFGALDGISISIII